MARPRNRINVTLSPEALEVYQAVAAEMRIPLPTFLRQCLEQGLPAMEQLLKAFHEKDPQERLKLVYDLQRSMAEEVSGLTRD